MSSIWVLSSRGDFIFWSGVEIGEGEGVGGRKSPKIPNLAAPIDF